MPEGMNTAVRQGSLVYKLKMNSLYAGVVSLTSPAIAKILHEYLNIRHIPIAICVVTNCDL